MSEKKEEKSNLIGLKESKIKNLFKFVFFKSSSFTVKSYFHIVSSLATKGQVRRRGKRKSKWKKRFSAKKEKMESKKA